MEGSRRYYLMKLEDMSCHFQVWGEMERKEYMWLERDPEVSSLTEPRGVYTCRESREVWHRPLRVPRVGALLHCPSSEARSCRPPSPPPKGILSGSCVLRRPGKCHARDFWSGHTGGQNILFKETLIHSNRVRQSPGYCFLGGLR